MLSLVFGFGPVILLALLAVMAWTVPAGAVYAISAAWLWGSAILIFLAGVTRGLSFAADSGPHLRQIVMMLALFLLGLAALALPVGIAFPMLAAGYTLVGITDPFAAHAELAPAHFARLRPPQMAIAVMALLALTLRVL